MAEAAVSIDKRVRVSLLLDTYGELLTEKQRRFLQHYFEEDLSFGEIARAYGVSRQAIFDAVRHGVEALEHYERALKLVASGWIKWSERGLTPEAVAERLAAWRDRVQGPPDVLAQCDRLIADLRGDDADEPPPEDAHV